MIKSLKIKSQKIRKKAISKRAIQIKIHPPPNSSIRFRDENKPYCLSMPGNADMPRGFLPCNDKKQQKDLQVKWLSTCNCSWRWWLAWYAPVTKCVLRTGDQGCAADVAVAVAVSGGCCDRSWCCYVAFGLDCCWCCLGGVAAGTVTVVLVSFFFVVTD